MHRITSSCPPPPPICGPATLVTDMTVTTGGWPPIQDQNDHEMTTARWRCAYCVRGEMKANLISRAPRLAAVNDLLQSSNTPHYDAHVTKPIARLTPPPPPPTPYLLPTQQLICLHGRYTHNKPAYQSRQITSPVRVLQSFMKIATVRCKPVLLYNLHLTSAADCGWATWSPARLTANCDIMLYIVLRAQAFSLL